MKESKRKILNDWIIMLVLECIVIGILAFAFKSIADMLFFTLSFTFLFFMPLSLWIVDKDENFLERWAFSNILGLSVVPFVYAFVAYFLTPLTLSIMLVVSLLITGAGVYWKLIKDNKKKTQSDLQDD